MQSLRASESWKKRLSYNLSDAYVLAPSGQIEKYDPDIDYWDGMHNNYRVGLRKGSINEHMYEVERRVSFGEGYIFRLKESNSSDIDIVLYTDKILELY